MFEPHADLKLFSVVATAFSLVACSGESETRTGRIGAGGGSAAGGMTNAGGSSSGSGSIGNAGAAGLTGTGGAPGSECKTNFDCPQTNCFGCPPTVCVNGRCTTLATPAAGGATGSGGNIGGLGGAVTAGGAMPIGGATATGGSSSTGAGGALPACGVASHLPQCEEYTRHTCALCDPAGCNESQLCYALSSCDSLYPTCPNHFSCALAATSCADFQACARCQL